MIQSEFKGFGLSEKLLRGIAAANWTDPRPIQSRAIPEALAGRDVLGLAPTGTGKTGAFALPILQSLLTDPDRKPGHPRALIVAPTRELASQIGEEIRTLASFTRIRVAVCFGGVSVHRQKLAMRERPEIVVACPGRLLDLESQGLVKLHRIETLVLDEADHMFDMGFLPDLRRILGKLPKERQNLLFSATMPPEIRALAHEVLRDPLVVESDSKPVSTVEHSLYPVADHKAKPGLLRDLLEKERISSAIVFTRTKHRAKRLAVQLERDGHRAVALQGNMSQNARERAMNGFREGAFDILVATDIAARGIDVQQVTHVINFDMPNTPDAYVHRIGRTGRAEREGRAYTFVVPEDRDTVRQVERRVGREIPRSAVEGWTTSFPSGARERRPEERPRSTRPRRPRRRRRQSA